MIYYPEETKSFKQLCGDVDAAYKTCSTLRETRLAAVKEYVGRNYAQNGAADSVPMNLLEFAVNTYLRQLVAQNPQVLVTTKFPELRPAASMFESALNQLLTEIDAYTTLKTAVLDAMFGVGVVKVGMSEDAREEILGHTHVVGVPFMDAIDIEDMYFDVRATRFDQQKFVGHRYCMPKDLAMESGLFENAEEAFEQYETRMRTNQNGSIKEVFDPDGHPDKEDDKTVTILELWLPHTNQIVSVLVDPMSCKIVSDKPLRIEEWTGPKNGPYYYLGFIDVPGQLLPNNPVSLWVDQHRFMNASMRKLMRQSSVQKDIFTFQSGDEDDAERVAKAHDGQTLRSDNPNAVDVKKFGGPDKDNLAFLLQFKQQFSELAGNLDSLGGIAPSANTVGQEGLLAEASNRRVMEMQDRVVAFTADVIRGIGENVWSAPAQSVLVQRKMEYQGITLLDNALEWPNPGRDDYPEDLREGPFENYDMDIEPYSMAHSSPSEKIAALDAVLQNEILPNAQLLAEQGLFIDFRRVAEIKSHYLNLPELKEVLIDQQGTLQQPNEPSGQPTFTGGKAPGAREVKHNYEGVRNSRAQTNNAAEQLMKDTPSDG